MWLGKFPSAEVTVHARRGKRKRSRIVDLSAGLVLATIHPWVRCSDDFESAMALRMASEPALSREFLGPSRLVLPDALRKRLRVIDSLVSQ